MTNTIARVALFIFVLLSGGVARSQFGVPQNADADRLGSERTQRWQVGMVITAKRGPCGSVYGTVSVPTNWPEQDVKVVEENISDRVGQIRYRDLKGGVRQMLVSVPRLNPGETAEALVTYEITRRAISAPVDTSVYHIPRSVPRSARKYLGSSPFIDTRNVKIRTLAKEIVAAHEEAWAKVDAIHQWVKDNIEHTNDRLKGSLNTLRDKRGNHEDLSGLFIALCRAAKIPARTVWVPDYCYAEFYLVDQEKKGHWFPCELKEKTVFGAVSNQYMILQKGENIRVPEKKEPLRFVKEFVKGKAGRGLGPPSVTFVRKVLPRQ